jgi:hypothetical protein
MISRPLSLADAFQSDVNLNGVKQNSARVALLYSSKGMAMRKQLILSISLIVFMILTATVEAGVHFSYHFSAGHPVRRTPPIVIQPHPYYKRYDGPSYAPRPYTKPNPVWIPGRWYRAPQGWQYAPGFWIHR